jgi:transcriptional/translational regulatory protein YebC/TACO1
LISHFLESVDERDLQSVTQETLSRTARSNKPVLFYESSSGRIEIYENPPSFEDVVHPLRNRSDYVIGVKPSYMSSESYFGMDKSDLEELTEQLYDRVHSDNDAYMKVLQDLES